MRKCLCTYDNYRGRLILLCGPVRSWRWLNWADSVCVVAYCDHWGTLIIWSVVWFARIIGLVRGLKNVRIGGGLRGIDVVVRYPRVTWGRLWFVRVLTPKASLTRDMCNCRCVRSRQKCSRSPGKDRRWWCRSEHWLRRVSFSLTARVLRRFRSRLRLQCPQRHGTWRLGTNDTIGRTRSTCCNVGALELGANGKVSLKILHNLRR